MAQLRDFINRKPQLPELNAEFKRADLTHDEWAFLFQDPVWQRINNTIPDSLWQKNDVFFVAHEDNIKQLNALLTDGWKVMGQPLSFGEHRALIHLEKRVCLLDAKDRLHWQGHLCGIAFFAK